MLMESVLGCPFCGGRPNLKSLDGVMKYSCYIHQFSGRWASTNEQAIENWNSRVLDYNRLVELKNTPGTPEFIYNLSSAIVHSYCEDCDYETDDMTMKDLVYHVSMEGGYIYGDKNGDYRSKCPKCESENLILHNPVNN